MIRGWSNEPEAQDRLSSDMLIYAKSVRVARMGNHYCAAVAEEDGYLRISFFILEGAAVLRFLEDYNR